MNFNSTEFTQKLERNRTGILAAVRQSLNPAFVSNGKPFLEQWFDSLLDSARKKPCRTSEWMSALAEGVQASGAGLAELLDQCRRLRVALCDHCAEKHDEAFSADSRDFVLYCAEHHDRHAVGAWSQLYRDAIASEHRRQRAMAEHIASPFCILDAEGRIVLANRLFAAAMSVPPEALAGEALASFCVEDAAEELRRCLRQQSPRGSRQFSGRLTMPSGQLLPVQFSVDPLFDARGRRDGLAVTMESTEVWPHGEEDQIMPALHACISFLPFGCQVANAGGEVLYASPNLRALLGPEVDPEHPLCCQLHQGEDQALAGCPCRRVLQTGEPFYGEIKIDSDEQTRWFQSLVVPMPAPTGEITRVLCAFFDVSKHRNLGRQLESHLLVHQGAPLASQLTMTVAHELRNPLSVVVGYTEMLLKGVPPEELSGVLSRVSRNAFRCKEIVEALLEFGRGAFEEHAQVDLTELIRKRVIPMFPSSDQGQIVWDLPDAPCLIECMPGQMALVCTNLLRNALTAARTSVLLRLRSTGGQARIEVADDGPGVPQELEDRIFEPFFTTRKEEGAIGLGLSLCLAVVRDFGGRLYLCPKESTPDNADQNWTGGHFAAEIPLAKNALASNRPGEPEPQDEPKNSRILVVDDEADLLDMLSMALHMEGLAVDTAGNGSEAMEKIRGHHFDAIALDVQLPGSLSGAQCYDYLLATQPALAQRTMFITGDTMGFKTQKFLQDSGRPYLEKPFLVQDFLDRIRTLLDLK